MQTKCQLTVFIPSAMITNLNVLNLHNYCKTIRVKQLFNKTRKLTASNSWSSGLWMLQKPPTYITLSKTFVFTGPTNIRYGICYLVFHHWSSLHTGHPNMLGTVAPNLQQRIRCPYPEPDPSSPDAPRLFLEDSF